MRNQATTRPLLLVLGLVLVTAIVLVWMNVRREPVPITTPVESVAADTKAVTAISPAIDAVEPVETARTSAAVEPKPIAAARPKDGRTHARLEGRITVGGRRPRAGKAVQLRLELLLPTVTGSEPVEQWWGDRKRTIEVDATGAYAADQLMLGKWRVGCEVDGAKWADKIVELETHGSTVRCDFDLEETRTFRLYLVDATGKPLDDTTDPVFAKQVAALRVVLSDAPFPPDGAVFENRSIVSTKTRSMSDLPPGEAHTVVETSAVGRLWCGVLLERTVLASIEVPFAAEVVTLSIAPDRLVAQVASLVVHVRNASTSAPIENAVIRLILPVGPHPEGKSDQHGICRLLDVVPAEVEVSVAAAGYVARKQRLSLEAASETQLTIDLPPEMTVSGVYRDAAGKPTTGSIIVAPLARRPRTPTSLDAGVRSGKTDANGTFRIGGLEPTQYVVMDAAQYQLQNTTSVFEPGKLPPGVQLVDLSFGPVAGVVVTQTVLQAR